MRSKQEPLKVILEAQFRPSQGNTVIEVSITSIDTVSFHERDPPPIRKTRKTLFATTSNAGVDLPTAFAHILLCKPLDVNAALEDCLVVDIHSLCLALQLPAGLIDKGESAAEAAVRELKEETGARAVPCMHGLQILTNLAIQVPESHKVPDNILCFDRIHNGNLAIHISQHLGRPLG